MRLDEPYSDCLVNLQDREEIDVYQQVYGTNYSTQVECDNGVDLLTMSKWLLLKLLYDNKSDLLVNQPKNGSWLIFQPINRATNKIWIQELTNWWIRLSLFVNCISNWIFLVIILFWVISGYNTIISALNGVILYF